MTEFTKDDIEYYRKQYALWTSRSQTTPEELHLIGRLRDALDEIERLQKENKELKEFVDATRPTGICEICTSNVISRYESLQARVQELEQEHDYLDTKCAAFENDFVLLDVIEKLKKAEARIVELEEALAKIANYESMRFRLSPYEYGLLEQIVGIAEHALRDGE